MSPEGQKQDLTLWAYLKSYKRGFLEDFGAFFISIKILEAIGD